MKKVKYMPTRNIKYAYLTEGYIYEVMGSYDGFINFINVKNDRGILDSFSRKDFVDVTSEYRAEVIDEILS